MGKVQGPPKFAPESVIVNNVAFSLPLCHRGRRLWTYNHKMALRGQRILVLHHQSGLQLTVFYAFVPCD